MGHRRRGQAGRWRQLVGWGALILLGWVLVSAVSLYRHAQAPTDALLVLGGSVRREIYVADQSWPAPRPPILISQGSPDPCIWLIFQRAESSMEGVWLEKCAQSTFENFVMALPVLRRWDTRHVQVITSATHLPRAQWLGWILLGSHGIWVEVAIAPETGIPGNQESALKTTLDILRSLGWALISQVYQPGCQQVVPLAEIDPQDWESGFKCEHQADLTPSDWPPSPATSSPAPGRSSDVETVPPPPSPEN